MSPTRITTNVRRFLGLTSVLATATVLVLAGSTPASAAVAHPTVRGHVDVVAATTGHIHVTGWSVDPIHYGTSNSTDVIVDGMMAALPLANKARPDVTKALHISGRHGFDVTVSARAGVHQVCVVGKPLANTGGRDVLLACKTVRVK